jgi:hypothetical protein
VVVPDIERQRQEDLEFKTCQGKVGETLSQKWRREEIRQGCRRVNIVELLCSHV